MILSKNCAGGLSQILQSLLLVFGGASMRHAVVKVKALAAGNNAG